MVYAFLFTVSNLLFFSGFYHLAWVAMIKTKKKKKKKDSVKPREKISGRSENLKKDQNYSDDFLKIKC